MNERNNDLDTGRESGPHTADDQDLRELMQAAGPREPVPPAHLEAIASAAELAWKRQLRQRQAARTPWVPKLPAAALAAALALAVGLAAWWVWQSVLTPESAARIAMVRGDVRLAEDHWPEPGESIPVGGRLVAAADGAGYAALELDGSTTVRIDSGSRVRFVSSRILELEAGAVYVDTGTGSGSPLERQIEVRTPFGSATDIGTRFSVRVRTEQPAGLEIQVRDGAVLTAQDDRTWRTEAGRKLTIAPDGGAEHAAVQPWGAEWSWVLAAAPGFDLESRTVGELVDWVADETGWRVVWADPDRAEAGRAIVIRGSFGSGGSPAARPDRLPFIVLPGAGLEGTLDDGTLVIRSAG